MPYLGNIPATQYSQLKYQDFTGGSGTSFTLNDPVGTAQELEVFVNNVRQEPGVAYTVSGTTLTMTGSIVASDDFYVVFQGKSVGTATHPAGQALTATEGTFSGAVALNGGANFGDSDKANFGDSADGELFHNGTHFILRETNTSGNMLLRGNSIFLESSDGSEQYATFNANGASVLKHDNSTKIATTTTGVDVTGNVDASGTVFGTNQILQVKKVTLSSTTQLTSSGGNHELSTSLRLAITPKASDSLLYMNFFAPFTYPNSNNLSYANFYDVTNSAAVGLPSTGGSRRAVGWHKRTTAFDANDMDTINLHAVITANNTNARTYTIYHSTEGAVAQFLQSTLSSGAGTNTVAFFWIMEVAA